MRATAILRAAKSRDLVQHHDLTSFLKYAERTSLAVSSTAYVGTRYEYTVQASLRRLGFDLTRVGGRSDKGIDLTGTWSLPSVPFPLKVIVQCKALATSLGPSVARELEGSVPAGWRAAPIAAVTEDEMGPPVGGGMALLVSPLTPTPGVRDALRRSSTPMGYVNVSAHSPEGDHEPGVVRQLLWNEAAAAIGLEAMGVTTRFVEASTEGYTREVAMTWRSKLWEPEEQNAL